MSAWNEIRSKAVRFKIQLLQEEDHLISDISNNTQ